MKILVLYLIYNFKGRNTIIEHLKCFERYSNSEIYYLNVAYGVPDFVKGSKFDLIIYHYTICGLKWVKPEESLFSENIRILKSIEGYKIAVPQDEYVHNNHVCAFFKEQGIGSIFTCFFKEDYDKAYPFDLCGVKHIETVLPGYLDEIALEKWSKVIKPHKDRKIDIGYRARKNPFWLGRLGLLKWQVADKFNEHNDNLRKDISTDPSKVYNGDTWYHFLTECRCVLGVESGSSLLDFDGSLREKVNKFQSEFPNESFEKCEELLFPGMDGNINLATLSPRHFEAMITRSCQVLVEGRYADILQPNIHYISIKKDFTNLDEVIEKIANKDYCEKMANFCFEDVIKNSKITYKDFVNQILSGVDKYLMKPSVDYPKEKYKDYLRYEKYPFLYYPIKLPFLKTKAYLKPIVVKLGLGDILIKK